MSAKPSFQLWYPGGERLKVISFSWSWVKSPSKCFSNTEPTAIIASRDEKRCNALSSERDWCTRVRYASVINTGNVTDDCFSSLSPRCSLTVLQLYICVHENSEVRNGSDIGSRKQAPQNSLVCKWWRVEPSHNHRLTSLFFCFFFYLFWTMDRRTRLVPIATTIHGPSALHIANARKSSFHSGLWCSITKVLCSAWGSP